MSRDELSAAARKALKFWPQIEYAAAESLSTADLWSAIHDATEELGLATPGVSASGVAELRSMAVRIQAAGRRFESGSVDATLGSDHMAQAPWSRTLPEQAAVSIFQVRYLHTVFADGENQTDWRTSVFTGALPATIGELRQAIEEDASELANKYGVGHVDFSNIQIVRV